MDELETQILSFIKNRHEKGESTASRHIHIRFDLEIPSIEKILGVLEEKNEISKFYDSEYQETRYNPQ